MTKFIIGAWLLVCAIAAQGQTPADSVALATAPWQTVSLGGGAESRHAQVNLFGSCQCISIARYPRKSFDTRIVSLDRQARPTSEFGEQEKAEIAVNGSYFNTRTFAPVTFVMVDGKILGHTTPQELTRTNGIIAFRDRRGRRIRIDFCDTADYPRIARRYHSALAAGPVLVHRGESVRYDSSAGFYTLRHPRTLIGTTRAGEVMMVVIDGRFPGQADGTTIAETAYIAQQLGLEEALNLDGGGSSTLWTARQGVLNHPYDNHRFDHEGQRDVPNCIVVHAHR